MRQLALFTPAVISRGLLGRRACRQSDCQSPRRAASSSESVTIKKGEAVTFANDDNVPHNIFLASKGNELNLGSQAPGAATDSLSRKPAMYR